MKTVFKWSSVAAFVALIWLTTGCDNTEKETEHLVADTTALRDSATFVAKLPEGYIYKHFSGKLEDGTPIEVEVTLNKGNAMVYWHQGTLSPVYAEGRADSAGVLHLMNDVRSENPTEFFTGSLTSRKLVGALKAENPKQIELLENYGEGSLRFEGFTKADSIKLINKPNSPEGHVDVAYLIPSSVDPAIDANKISTMLLPFYFGDKSKAPDIRTGAQQEIGFFRDDYTSVGKNFNGEFGAAFNWQSFSESRVVFNNKYILSLQVSRYEYTGGAHGFSSSEFRVIDLKSAKRLKLEDVFNKNYRSSLIKLIEQNLRTTFRISKEKTLEEGGLLVPAVEPTENFFLTDKGIGFVYNPYEIAAYSYGNVEVFLSFDQVSKIIKEDIVEQLK